MICFLIFALYTAFPERKDSLLFSNDAVIYDSSGSLGIYVNGKCEKTRPEYVSTRDRKTDWCSNIVTEKNQKPWISFHIRNQFFELTGFSLRNGCCDYLCCCDETGEIYADAVDGCCTLYSFSLEGSNDNETWTTIHKEEKVKNFYACESRTFEFPKTKEYKYIRLNQDEPYPGCFNCIQINQIELYGKTTTNSMSYDDNDDDNDESVSIIGKVSRNDVE